MDTKTAFAELARRVVAKGRKPASEAAQEAIRRAKLLAEKGPKGRPKRMEIPRTAYVAETTGAHGTGLVSRTGGAQTAKQMKELEKRKLQEQLARSQTLFSKQGSDPTPAADFLAGQRKIDPEALKDLNLPLSLDNFKHAFLEELRNIQR